MDACAIDSCGTNFEEALSRLSGDFDGDRKADSAKAGRIGASYCIEVRLSTKRPRVRLSIPIRNEIGLELFAYDINQDSHADLVLTSVSSPKPIAVWLNKGNGSFERASGTFAPFVAPNGGPAFRRGTARNDAQAALPTDDPPPDAGLTENIAFALESTLIGRHAEQSPLPISDIGAAPPRGPPCNPLQSI